MEALGNIAEAIDAYRQVLVPDWRWLLERPDSPWYPTMRLFRQSKLGQWADVFARVEAELADKLAGRVETLRREH